VRVTGAGWLDAADYPLVRDPLERAFPAILDELRGIVADPVWTTWGSAHYSPNIAKMSLGEVRRALTSDQRRIGAAAEPGWLVFALALMGDPFADHCRRCPRTADVVASIPGVRSAAFTCLEPGYHTWPHVGTVPVHRAHLGLVIPQGDCGLRVDGETRGWEPGRVLIFDDLHVHEAWNHTAEPRFVLIVDVPPR
jgi:aspartyl/asparaginyl beta-hydroxylase (cupin superfamily)